LFLDHR